MVSLTADSSLGIAGFVDVETTGLSSATEEIIEFALCLFEFSRETGVITRITEQYVGLREPVVPISPGAARVHGICTHDVRGKRLDYARIEAMLHKAEFLIAHNASFDRGFIVRLFDICTQKPWLCSMRGIRWREKGFVSMGLQNLLRDHGINVHRSHRAEDDVKAAIKLLSQINQNGKTYFQELVESQLK